MVYEFTTRVRSFSFQNRVDNSESREYPIFVISDGRIRFLERVINLLHFTTTFVGFSQPLVTLQLNDLLISYK